MTTNKERRQRWRNRVDTHLIYGYRERGGRHRWYIGCTLVSRRRIRDQHHRKALEEKKYFHRFIRKAYREGKSFGDVLEYFEIETFRGTAKQAEVREIHYTFLYDALAPNGFVLKAGRYQGAMAEPLKRVISEKNKKVWKCAAKRASQAIKCSGWKHSDEIKTQIGETQRNFSPEKKAQKEAGARATRAITKKRKNDSQIHRR